jgi:DNA polymerase-3 subunit delta'
LALEFAKALNCTASGTPPCDACPACEQMGRGTHPDLHGLGPKGASAQIPIDDVRLLLARLSLRPFSARVQVAILDGAERLTDEAANSLLKLLEEPPASARFVLTTSRPQDCLSTIVSRCQLIRCAPLPQAAVEQLLVHAQGCPPDVARAVAPLAGGSLSAALELAARWGEHEAALARLAEGPALSWLERPLPDTRQEVAGLLERMVGWMRDLAVAAAASPASRRQEGQAGDRQLLRHARHMEAIRRQAEGLDVDRCLAAAFALIALRESMDQFVSPRLIAALAREQWLDLVTRET